MCKTWVFNRTVSALQDNDTWIVFSSGNKSGRGSYAPHFFQNMLFLLYFTNSCLLVSSKQFPDGTKMRRKGYRVWRSHDLGVFTPRSSVLIHGYPWGMSKIMDIPWMSFLSWNIDETSPGKQTYHALSDIRRMSPYNISWISKISIHHKMNNT